MEVDGRDLSSAVTGYQVTQVPGEPAQVTLLAAPGGAGVEFEGLSSVTVQVEDPHGAVADFLAETNPEMLHRAALARTDLDGRPGELTRAVLATLREWAAAGE
ncbi:hypothetical protein ACN20G_33460 (plasmid) [Streptomyces sp. BI20]|uniref:hypothetical protein n=1 Tax=Streptomyces sp. BI20 TaxID=3403460 RepID=UPI003C7681B1